MVHTPTITDITSLIITLTQEQGNMYTSTQTHSHKIGPSTSFYFPKKEKNGGKQNKTGDPEDAQPRPVPLYKMVQ